MLLNINIVVKFIDNYWTKQGRGLIIMLGIVVQRQNVTLEQF